MQETQVWSLGGEDPLEKEVATLSSILAWRIPWTEEPNGLQSMGLQRFRHDWAAKQQRWSHNNLKFTKERLILRCSNTNKSIPTFLILHKRLKNKAYTKFKKANTKLKKAYTKIRLCLRMCGIQKYAFLSFKENRKAGCQKPVFLTQGIMGVLKYALHSSAVLFWQKKVRLQNTSNLDTPA